MSISPNTRYLYRTIFLLGLFLCFSFSTQAQNKKESDFTIGVSGAAPFVTGPNNEQGISLEVWEETALEIGVQYKIKSFENIPDALQALKDGEIDAVVGPTSITAERAKEIIFTQPYYESSLAILSRAEDPSIWDRIKPFFNTNFFIAICTFIFILAIVGFFLWVAEHKQNTEEFPQHPLKGIGNGMWLAIVTMTTTGYGDLAPKTTAGRIIAGSWMIISLTFAASMIAGISSTLTLTGMGTNTINTAKELHDKKVAVVTGSPAADFVKKYGGESIEIDSLGQGYTLLKDKSVDAIVYDRPQLKNFLKNKPEGSLSLSKAEYMRRGYGFAIGDSLSGIVSELNTAILKMKETGQMNRIEKAWLGSKTAE